jgi:hypothetical protein
MATNATPQPGDPILLFDGNSTQIEVASGPAYSLPPRNTLTISAWIRPDTVEFPRQEGTNYVHWMGKGETGKQEWLFRMYSYKTTDKPCPRPNRTSFYVFNPSGGRGTGSFEEERVEIGEWMHIVGVADVGCTHFFKNGTFRDCDIYNDSESNHCVAHPASPNYHGVCDSSTDPVTPVAGDAPLRIGTLDGHSYFLGAVARVRIWQRILSDDEIQAMYESDAATPKDDLVAEFLLNEGSGTVATDSSGNANNGVITAGTWGTQT